MGRCAAPARIRRHPRAVGIRPPPTRSWPRADAIDVRPRRVRCGGCGATQVLLPAALPPRRADATEVIATALARKAAGWDIGGSPPYWAARRPPSSVAAPARGRGHLTRLWQRGAQELVRLDAGAFNQLASTGNLLRDVFTVLAAAAWWTRRRLGIADRYGRLSGSTPAGGFSPRPAEPPSRPGPVAGPAVSHARLRPSR